MVLVGKSMLYFMATNLIMETLEENFKYMTNFMISIPIITNKMNNNPKIIMDESLWTIVI